MSQLIHSCTPIPQRTLGPVYELSLLVIQFKPMLPSLDIYKIYQSSKASEPNSDAP